MTDKFECFVTLLYLCVSVEYCYIFIEHTFNTSSFITDTLQEYVQKRNIRGFLLEYYPWKARTRVFQSS